MKFVWNLSSKILQNITGIERIYGQLEGMRLPQKLQLNLERNNLVQSSYVSNSIEGNPLSLPEVTNLLLGDRLPVNRDEKEVYNYFSILKNLHKYIDKELTTSLILIIHRELLTGVNDEIAGKIRNSKVVVGGYKNIDGKLKLNIKHEPPTHNKIDITEMLGALCYWLENTKEIPNIIKIALFHHHFVYIHPFLDGNGRTCRLLTALLFLKYGYKINKYFVLDDYYDVDRPLYSDSLHTADQGVHTQWITYFTDGVKYSLQSALSKAKTATKTLSIETRLTMKEKEILTHIEQWQEVTTSDIVEVFQISRQQAHHRLSSLVKKGLLEKIGSTKSSKYILI